MTINMNRVLSCAILCFCVCFFQTQGYCKKALIFGVTGQDGTYLSEFLLSKNYEVHGVRRRTSFHNTVRIDPLLKEGSLFYLHFGDVTDATAVLRLIKEIHPDEIYNLAAQSDVSISFEIPEYTTQVNAIGTLNILEAIRVSGLIGQTKFYQASTSELFGQVQEIPQTEKTPFHPRSPYAVAKLYSYWITINYREAFGLFACNGLLFNHESPVRGEEFVTRKITLGACRYKLGLQEVLYLGNLDARRDWGYAKDYVQAMWLMLQEDIPDDYLIASGEDHSVREFVELAYRTLGIEIQWKGSGIFECGIDKATGKKIIGVDPKYYRPSEVDQLLGCPEKARQKLNWTSTISFHELVKIMVETDYDLLAAKDFYSRSHP